MIGFPGTIVGYPATTLHDEDLAMLALETVVSISDHRLVIEDQSLPARADRARVIVLWDAAKPSGRRQPPPSLAGMGEEIGDILTGAPNSDWEALA